MFDLLASGFEKAKQSFSGKATLTEDNITEALKSIRESLLEADVEYGVMKDFLSTVKEKSIGKSVDLKAGASSGNRGAVKVSPSDHFIKICHEELKSLLGEGEQKIEFVSNRPTIILMVGLQGGGKTTSTGKLAKYFVEKFGRKPLLVAADIYRPAAIDQLKVLGSRINIPVFNLPGALPTDIARKGLQAAFDQSRDTVLIDTAGRLTIDETLMGELKAIKAAVNPDHILFVCDAMMGQDAVTTAKAFDDQLGLSGIVMTKMDGDARGGAALSVKQITGKPIKFLGVGESLEQFEEFRPEGLASRILGMGDVVGLMQDFEKAHKGDLEADVNKMLEGQFNFKDFYEQLGMIQRMGSLKDILAKLPMQNMIPKDIKLDDREFGKIKSMIDSMTEKERLNPALFNESRVSRIAKGSGNKVQEVQGMIKRFKSMRQMMGGIGKGFGSGMMSKIPGMGALGQMNQMRQMAQQMMKNGGAGMPDLFGGSPGLAGSEANQTRKVDRDKLKKLRKQAKDARKRNRK